MKCPKQVNAQRQRADDRFPGVGGWREGSDGRGERALFETDENAPRSDVCTAMNVLTCTLQMGELCYVNYISIKLRISLK